MLQRKLERLENKYSWIDELKEGDLFADNENYCLTVGLVNYSKGGHDYHRYAVRIVDNPVGYRYISLPQGKIRATLPKTFRYMYQMRNYLKANAEKLGLISE